MNLNITTKLFISFFCMLSLLLVTSSSFAIQFSEAEKQDLKNGKIVRQALKSSGKNGFYGGSGFAVVNAPVEKVWKTLVTWNKYTKMFPNTTEAKELSRKGNLRLLRMKLGHPVISMQYHVQMTLNKKKKILSFELVSDMKNDVDSLKGYWRLFPQKNGRTLIAYVVALRVPIGIVNFVGPELEKSAFELLLSLPFDVKCWLEGIVRPED